MAMEQSQITSYASLLALLERDGVMHLNHAVDQTVQIPTQRGQLDGILLIRWQEADGVVQFIQSLPVPVPEDKIPAMESAIARLNHALALPGLDLNHEYRSLVYRQTLPLFPRGYVMPDELQAMFRLCVKTASDVLPTLVRIIRGESQAVNAVAEVQRDMTQAAETPPLTASAPAPGSASAEPAPAAPAAPAAQAPSEAAATEGSAPATNLPSALNTY